MCTGLLRGDVRRQRRTVALSRATAAAAVPVPRAARRQRDVAERCGRATVQRKGW